jgi:ribokinase
VQGKLDIIAVGHGLVDIRFIVDRFPGPDEEAGITRQVRSVGGSAANVALDTVKLGGKAGVILKVGLDGFGRMIIDELMREKVDVSGVKVCLGESGFTIVVIDGAGRIIMYGFKGAAERLEPHEIDETIISRGRFLHIASLREDTSLRAAELAKKHGLTVSWDPGRRLALKGLDAFRDLLRNVDIVLVNRFEAKSLTGIDDPGEAAARIMATGPSIVVVKKGGEGVYVRSRGGEEIDLPAFPVPRVVDTTGAGDAFAAGLLLGLGRGYNLRKAVVYANAVAALKTARLGSHSVPSHEEVIKYIWEHGIEY